MLQCGTQVQEGIVLAMGPFLEYGSGPYIRVGSGGMEGDRDTWRALLGGATTCPGMAHSQPHGLQHLEGGAWATRRCSPIHVAHGLDLGDPFHCGQRL